MKVFMTTLRNVMICAAFFAGGTTEAMAGDALHWSTGEEYCSGYWISHPLQPIYKECRARDHPQALFCHIWLMHAPE